MHTHPVVGLRKDEYEIAPARSRKLNTKPNSSSHFPRVRLQHMLCVIIIYVKVVNKSDMPATPLAIKIDKFVDPGN
jgi:hypothetical protein